LISKKPIFDKQKLSNELNLWVIDFDRIEIKIRSSIEKSKTNVKDSIEKLKVDFGLKKDKKDKDKSSSTEK
jgi:hypothetical protein